MDINNKKNMRLEIIIDLDYMVQPASSNIPTPHSHASSSSESEEIKVIYSQPPHFDTEDYVKFSEQDFSEIFSSYARLTLH